MPEEPIDVSGKKSHGEVEGGEGTSGRTSVPKEKQKRSAASIYTRPDRAERAWERDLRVRLERTFERLTEWLDGRGDEELATVIKEDGLAMTGGIIALARPLAWIRPVLVAVLTVVEPLMAFGRLFRVLVFRWSDRRELRAQELEQQQAEDEGARLYREDEHDVTPPEDLGGGPLS